MARARNPSFMCIDPREAVLSGVYRASAPSALAARGRLCYTSPPARFRHIPTNEGGRRRFLAPRETMSERLRRVKYAQDVLGTMGNTPLVRLNTVTKDVK